MINVILHGAAGRMGQVVANLIAQRSDCQVVAGIDNIIGDSANFPVFPALADIDTNIKADVVIDFSHPAAVATLLPACTQHGLPCVVCTTGLDDDTQALLRETAAQTAVFQSANMSLGINLLAKLAQKAQAVLKGFDVEIVEYHHRHKLDAPSGTAYMLADAINEQAGRRFEYVYDRHERRQERSDAEIGISAVRGGSIVGRHDVLFAGQDEVVTLSHEATSRGVFANGAIAAALFVVGKKPGLYSMDNLLGDI